MLFRESINSARLAPRVARRPPRKVLRHFTHMTHNHMENNVVGY
jgi:hypothetical protein